MGTVVKGDLLKEVDVEVSCEVFGSVKRKERSYGQKGECGMF